MPDDFFLFFFNAQYKVQSIRNFFICILFQVRHYRSQKNMSQRAFHLSDPGSLKVT